MKPHQQSTVFTLLELNKSQREIHRITGIDRKTIRRYTAIFAARATASANSPVPATIGSRPSDQTPPPPRPPAFQATPAEAHNFDFARIVEQACSQARQYRLQSYKQVRGLVERLFERALEQLDQASQLALPLTQDHALIRPAAEYGELFSLGARQQLNQSSLTTGENKE
ncbi:hypothetical protein [Paraburkholderia nemoris]|uniref:hypothetical protein n=1 Tax=Paraburkholderia nemoris TaxID=2793076 RepID=UPI001B8C73EA